MPYDVSEMWNINFFKKLTDIEKRLKVARGGGGGWGE